MWPPGSVGGGVGVGEVVARVQYYPGDKRLVVSGRRSAWMT